MLCLLLSAFWLLSGMQVFAQPGPMFAAPVMPANGPDAADNDNSGAGTFPAPDRATLQQLMRAREAVKQGRSGEALDGLQEILKSNEDYFIQPDKDKKDSAHPDIIWRSLKAEARALIGQLPKEGLELYELRCGAEARSKLKSAIASSDPAAMGEVVSQFFYTQAGDEATFLMAMYYFDHRSPRAAIELFRRLQGLGEVSARFEPAMSLALAASYQQIGELEDCRKTLVDLKQRFGQSDLKIGGREVAWFGQDRDAVAWAAKLVGTQISSQTLPSDDWLMVRGNPERNAAVTASAPLLNMRWRVNIDEEAGELQTLKAQQQDYREKNLPLVPCLHPLAVGDVVLMRTVDTLVAVNFNTGKRIWNIELNEDRDASTRQNPVRIGMGGMGRFRNVQNMPTMLGQRIWDDAAYGTISSDGRLVFTIEDLGLGVTVANPQFFFGRGMRSEAGNPGQYNRLAAHELSSQGKARWDLGGEGGANALPQAETFFLGAPLVLHGVLYVEGEYRDEIRLLALDAATGQQLWMQHLAMVERNITQDPLRRLSGVSPSYSDGVLICPTGAGCAVAVDLTTHSLLWGCRYPHMKESNFENQRQQQMMMMMQGVYSGQGSFPHWIDGTAMIIDGKVVLTPIEADALYCLNLTDGKLLWGPLPRKGDASGQTSSDQSSHVPEERLYVACAHQGKLIVVGQRQVEAFHLSDGKPAWDSGALKLPDDAVVSGRGYYSHGHYFLPLSSAAVADIDLDSGKIVSTVKSQKGSVPGNLICHRGMVLSQGIEGLEEFYQIDNARDKVSKGLAANPNDPDFLSLDGELLLGDGKSAEAVAQFRRAYALDATGESHERTRELFRDALLSGLEKDFAGHRAYSAEIEGLLDEPSQHSLYLRLMAGGFHKSHDWPAALDSYLKLADLPPAKPDLEEIDHTHLVRRDRWVQAHLTALRADGGEPVAAAIDKALGERLAAMKSLPDPKRLAALRKFTALFTDQPIAAQARSELAQLAAKEGALLEAELAIEAGRASPDPASRAAALADEIDLFAGAGKYNEAASLVRYLDHRYAEVVCRDGKRPEEFLAGMAADNPLKKALGQSSPTWPLGVVEATPSRGNQGYARTMRMAVMMQGSSTAFADTGVRFDQQQQSVCGYDGQGKLSWEVRMVEANRPNNGFMYNPNMTLARSCGHVILFSSGTKIYGLDPLKLSGRDTQILWSQDLGDSSADEAGGGMPFMQRGMVFVNGYRQPQFRMDPFGPTTCRTVCFQRLRNLVAVDPLSGETLWVRKELPQNAEIFGDDQYVFVLDRQNTNNGNPYSASAADPFGGAQGRSGGGAADADPLALVFRASDGEFLGKRKIPQNPNYQNPYDSDQLARMVTSRFVALGWTFIGRNILYFSQDPDDRGSELRLFDPWEQRDVWSVKDLANGAKTAMIAHDEVGVLEPNGHFLLVSLPDGRKRFDVQLSTEKKLKLTELILARLGDQYIVIAHDGKLRHTESMTQPNMQPSQPLQGMLSHPIRHGRVFALSLQGKPVWPEAVEVENQQLLVSQPGGLPILAFAGYRYDQGHPNQVKTILKVIDRRNGRVVYPETTKDEPMNGGMALDISGDAIEKTVELHMMTSRLTLTFTDQPVPPPNPKDENKSAGGKVSDARGSSSLQGLPKTLDAAE
jgi:outer membrane protein assembly factor BamB